MVLINHMVEHGTDVLYFASLLAQYLQSKFHNLKLVSRPEQITDDEIHIFTILLGKGQEGRIIWWGKKIIKDSNGFIDNS